jgi:hypothetical protein
MSKELKHTFLLATPLPFLLFFAFSLGFSPTLISIMVLNGFLAFSEFSNFFMVVGAQILRLSSTSLKEKENGSSFYPIKEKKKKKDSRERSHIPKRQTEVNSKLEMALNTGFTTLEPPTEWELTKSWK